MTLQGKIPKSGNNKLLEADAGLDQTVSEGSTVILNGRGFTTLDQGKVSYSWSDISPGNYNITITKDDSPNPTFKAPYILDDENGHIEPRIILTFQLVVSDNKGVTSNPSQVSITVKRVQRAIVFQGGVSLGAYEAGVFQALVEKLTKEDSKRGVRRRPLFDIVAGASIGAMNGAIVVSSVTKEDKRWEEAESWIDSAKELVEFWRVQEYLWPTIAEGLDMYPMYHFWLDILHNTSKVLKHSATELIELYSDMNAAFKKSYGDILTKWFPADPSLLKDYLLDGWYIPATAEAARRYYSAKQIDFFGAFNVATGILPWSAFGKFLDFTYQPNYLFRPDNKHYVLTSLKETLRLFAHFPIKPKQEKSGEPRFLLVTVDAQTGDAVTFDSYSIEAKYHDDRNSIANKSGVEIDHALASGTFPGFFDYPKFKVDNAQTGIKNEEHIFWDGGYRSNTPLREVIQAHRDYWHKTRKHKQEEQEQGIKEHEDREDDVPDLEIYIADLWPSELKEQPISFDLDFVEKRKRDLLLGDKTDYDEQVANVVTDYVDLAKQLKNLAKGKGASEEEINYILDRNASSKNTLGKTRKYKELLLGRFRLTRVVRIDRKDDVNEVGNNIFDYSRTTVEKLMEDGYLDACIKMGIQSMRDEFLKLEKKIVELNDISERKKDLEKAEQELQQIQQSVKLDKGHDATAIINQVEDFIDKIRSMPDGVKIKNYNTPIREEKMLLIDAAKEFQEMMI